MRWTHACMSVAIGVLVVIAPPASADEDAKKTVREKHAEFDRLREEDRKAREKARKNPLSFHREDPRLFEARVAFVEAFLATDPESWDPSKDRDLLETGCKLGAVDSLMEGEFEPSIRLSELYLKHFPDTKRAGYVRSQGLPRALMASGDLPRALARTRELVKDLGPEDRPDGFRVLGDLLAASGDYAKAHDAYRRALVAIEDAAKGSPSDDEVGRRAAALTGMVRSSEVKHRASLIGRRAPKLVARTGGGGAPRLVSSPKGAVQVLLFCSVGVMGSGRQLVTLDDMLAEFGKDRIRPLGLACIDTHGSPFGRKEVFLPKGREERGGESVEVTEKTFPAAVRRVHGRYDLKFPLAVVDADHIRSWVGGRGEGCVVIDGDGKIAHVHASMSLTFDAVALRGLIRGVVARCTPKKPPKDE